MLAEPNISDILQQFHAALQKKRLRLGELLGAMKDRGPFFVVLVLSVPFLQPVALPGVSTPFGFLIALMWVGVLLRRDMPIPGRIQRYQLPPRGVSMLFRGGIALFRRLEKWTKPRYAPFVEQEGFRRFHALMMIAAAILLMLPLPVPFSNTLPAYAISFMSLGYLQRDGAMMLVSYGFSLLTIAYFTAIAVLGVEGFQWLALADWRPWS